MQPFVRTLAPIPKQRLRDAVTKLADDPRHSELDIKQLLIDGDDRMFRCRVGDYRIIYSVRPTYTYIRRIIHRSEGYGWLDSLE